MLYTLGPMRWLNHPSVPRRVDDDVQPRRTSLSSSSVRALVTGANGFVGQHLVAHLEERGDVALCPETDITDRASILAKVEQLRPDVVYHLAAQADVGASWSNPIETLKVNVEGTLNVLDAAREAGVQRVLAVNSADVYGSVDESELPLTERSELRPTSPYAASKAAAEMLCIQANRGYGLDVVRTRSFNHLGPGQSDQFVASAIAHRIVKSEKSGSGSIRIGNLDARRDFTDVRDVARAYRMLMISGSPGEVYNVCSGTDRSIRELAEILAGMALNPVSLETDPDLVRPVDLMVLRGDPTKLRESTGWQPAIPLETTLSDLLQHWRSRQPHT